MSNPYAITLRDGGGTFRVDLNSPEPIEQATNLAGYTVGLIEGSAIVIRPSLRGSLHPVDLVEHAIRFVAASYRVGLVGTWNDGERIHIDPVTVIADFDEAIDLGKRNAQESIYDNRKNEVIDL